MTDNEIIKALRCCFVESDCTECPYYGNTHVKDCLKEAGIKAINIINRQNAEIEQLKRNLEQCETGYRQQIYLLQHKFDDEKMKFLVRNIEM